MASTNNKLKVQDVEISLATIDNQDYISLTDMAKGKNDEARAADIIKNWIRNRSTLEFLGTWEILYNPNFKVVEFDHLKKEAGLPIFTISVSNWVESTNAIGILSRKGKYGGTYAHKDIAFEFGAAISPVFKLYLIKEYQRLKELESNQYNLEWNVKRILSKANYHIHTDAVKNYILPTLSELKEAFVYADEADLLNLAMFGCTAKQWKAANPERALKGENIRDIASINELAILSNIESLNASLIKHNVVKEERFKILVETIKEQRAVLDKVDYLKSIKKLSNETYTSMESNKQLDK